MKRYLASLSAIIAFSVAASGNLYTRAGFSYQAADDFYGGQNSFAETVFETAEGEYSFFNYTIDVAYETEAGLYVASGVYTTDGEVSTNGLGLGIPDTESGIEPREIPLAVGYNLKTEVIDFRFEARYTFNIDDDFDVEFGQAIDEAVILPVTDGSDYLTLSLRAKGEIGGLENVATIGYRIYEDDVTHPIFPEFSLGDEFYFDYELGYVVETFRFFVGHLVSIGQETEGTLSPITGTAYLTEKPYYLEIRGGAQAAVTNRLFLDAGIRYYYEGEDAPRQRTFFAGGTFIF